MPTVIASATDDKINVVTSDFGIKGQAGDDGVDGLGFNDVRGSLIDAPLLKVLNKNDFLGVGAQFLSWDRNSTANGFNRYGEFATADSGIPRQELEGWLFEVERTNLLLNSESLSTQSVDVTAEPHTLSFYGTGSVTLSGVAVATLNGTAADERVDLTFTPAAGSLTLTVSGTVTLANLEVGSFPTRYITTTGTEQTRDADVVSIPAGGNLPALGLPFTAILRIRPYALEDNTTLLSLPDGFTVSLDSAGNVVVTYNSVTATGSISADEDVTLIAMYDGSSIALYINGTLAESNVATPLSTTDPQGIINILDGFSGWVNDVTLYDFSLTASEIQLIGGSNG